MIILYQFPGMWGLPNASPFCVKLETYLRMAEIPYEIRFVMNPKKSPKGKLPFIKMDGEPYADTELIINHLQEKFGYPLDRHLNHEQRALNLLLEATFCERLYWIMLYFRWLDESEWAHVKQAFFAKIPAFSKWFLPCMVRKNMIKSLKSQGIGRHTPQEVQEMGYRSLDAVAAILADKKYFHGDELTTIDATAFGFLSNILWLPFEDPLKKHVQQHQNLLHYCDKIWTNFYPEMPKPFNLF
ncbi:glutathione S-transferase family protein [Legionella jordanis]|uniref:GST N-terminal domain-containing protein n=1 Tax=Legionella jordanis TaxID=456 RepID=A0A0W0VEB1_9GAMM|nr:glutathione S-transferase family protein [Legionella jordanis]KTD18424.1 hypothetical protein Ljor_2730 [Legionella jordanis]RMX05330.1 glutathione S-transferase family protein [Legionella jordanis]RMX20819.1 glutathione S-transferase family protein [Legionella jordanis]VEH13227.1 Uncharacterised protein [Legionella jordanis]HAT8713581.1 glutathione S-transferase family protein [Legionella jordanis]